MVEIRSWWFTTKLCIKAVIYCFLKCCTLFEHHLLSDINLWLSLGHQSLFNYFSRCQIFFEIHWIILNYLWNDNTNGKKVYTQYYMLDHIRFGSQRVNLGAVVVVRYDKGSLNGQKMNNRQKIDKKTRKKWQCSEHSFLKLNWA